VPDSSGARRPAAGVHRQPARPQARRNHAERCPSPEPVDAFLRGVHPAVIASVRADGSPHSAATWYDWDDGRVLLNMDDSRLRLRFLRRDPRISLTVLDTQSWYRHITLVGHATELNADTDLAGIDRLARRYTREAYPDRAGSRTIRVGGRGELARLGRFRRDPDHAEWKDTARAVTPETGPGRAGSRLRGAGFRRPPCRW